MALEQIQKYIKKYDFKIKTKKFERIGFERILDLLYLLKIINHEDYSQMNEVNDYRNDIVHTVEKIDFDKAKKQIQHCIDCWKRLFKQKL